MVNKLFTTKPYKRQTFAFSSSWGMLIIFMFALCFFLQASNIHAQQGGGFVGQSGGGFVGPGPDFISIKNALKMPDDAPVSLRGNIIRNLGNEHYIFQDATGTIEIEIDNDKWWGLTVGPEDVLIITGEIDKEWTRIKVDVSSVQKAR